MKTVNLIRTGYLLLITGFFITCFFLSSCGTVRYKTTHKHQTHFPGHQVEHTCSSPDW
jgi:hypothetical protein